MSHQCIHKGDDGEQCPAMVDTGLFCATHAVEDSKPAPGRGGGGGGGGLNKSRLFGESSLLRRMGVVYHHEPPDKKNYPKP